MARCQNSVLKTTRLNVRFVVIHHAILYILQHHFVPLTKHFKTITIPNDNNIAI